MWRVDRSAELARSLGLPGVAVEFGRVALRITDPVVDIPWIGEEGGITADRRRARIELFDTRFAIEEGRQVTIEVGANSPSGFVENQLGTTVTALLLAQRGLFALHANAVRGPAGAILIAGDSGAGKSTASARLDQRGFAFLADDLSPLTLSEGEIRLEPTRRPLRLSHDAATALDLETDRAPREPFASDKLIFRVPDRVLEPVVAAVVLETAAEGGDLTVTPLQGMTALAAAEAHLYRGWLLHEIYRSETFAWAGAVASLPIFRLVRPLSAWTIDDVADAIARLAGGD